jgi:hypothetical protein
MGDTVASRRRQRVTLRDRLRRGCWRVRGAYSLPLMPMCVHAITRLGSAELVVVQRPYTISQQALRSADAALAAGANSPVLWRLRLVASCGGEEIMQLRARWVCVGAAGVYRDLIGIMPNLSGS